MPRKLLAIALMAWCVCAQASADIKWLEMVHDFGAFSEDNDKIKAAFRFVNTGTDDVVIIQVAASCGCTVPTYDTAPVAPGDTAVINVAYNPIGRPGRFSKYVYVRTSANNNRDKLTIKGVVIGNPETIKGRYPVDLGDFKVRSGAAMLGRVAAGRSKSEFVDGYNQSADSMRLVFADVPEYLTVKSSPEVIAPGEIGSLDFYFDGSKCKQWGIVTDSISVSADGGTTFLPYPVVAIVEEDFSKLTPEQLAAAPVMAVDDRIDLGDVPEHSTTPVEKKVKITNRGKTPLKIHRIYAQDPGLKGTADREQVLPGKDAILTITYDPSYQPTGIIDTRITIITNDPSASTRTLRIVGLRQ